MNNLARFENDGVELVIDTVTEEAYASQAGYARMSGVAYNTVRKRVERLKGSDRIVLETTEIQTTSGLQDSSLIPVRTIMDWLLKDYHRNPTQQIFKSLTKIYQQQGLDIGALENLHNFNKGNKSKLKGADREKQIQLAYHLRYGGIIEYPTANGRIDLLTDTTIYEFKIFKDYKSCLGQLLAYDDCVPQLKLCAVLFGVPKALNFNDSECRRVAVLLHKYGITTKFLR